MKAVLLHMLRGFGMGAADLVPGVSGGTVALVLGIYRRLIGTIRTGAGALAALVRLDWRGFIERLGQVEWSFFLPLLAGILTAVLSLSHLIEDLLETQPLRMAGLFFGLVAGSIVVAWRLVDNRDALRLAILMASALATFLLLGLNAGPVADPSWWMFLGSGAVAICAMILPGISGSFILLMIGMYPAVLGAVNDRDIVSIVVFALGATAGLAAFSTLLQALLDRYQDEVMAALVGLMAGSLRVLWPWPEGTGGTVLAAPAGDVVWPVVLAVVGAVIVLAVTRREEALEAQVDEAADELEQPSP